MQNWIAASLEATLPMKDVLKGAQGGGGTVMRPAGSSPMDMSKKTLGPFRAVQNGADRCRTVRHGYELL